MWFKKKHSKNVWFFITIVLLISCTTSAYADRGPLGEGPEWGDPPGGYYERGGERIKLLYQMVYLDDWRDREELGSLAEDMLAKDANCHLWDDQWYSNALPTSRNKLLLLVWWNMDAQEFGWGAIKCTTGGWYTSSNYEGWQKLSNDEHKKYKWITNGYHVHISFYNPDNEGGWTGNHFWYGFGYPG